MGQHFWRGTRSALMPPQRQPLPWCSRQPSHWQLFLLNMLCGQADGAQHLPTTAPAQQAGGCPWERADWLRDDASLWKSFWGISCSPWARLYWQSLHCQHDCVARGTDTNTTRNGRLRMKCGWQLSSTTWTSPAGHIPDWGCNRGFLLLVCLNTVKLDVFFYKRNGIVLHAVWKKHSTNFATQLCFSPCFLI